jgi:hypothetical protein
MSLVHLRVVDFTGLRAHHFRMATLHEVHATLARITAAPEERKLSTCNSSWPAACSPQRDRRRVVYAKVDLDSWRDVQRAATARGDRATGDHGRTILGHDDRA